MPAAEQAHPSNGKKVPYTGKATENPNATIVPGKMRSDREEVPEGFTKEDADKAETMEARIIQRQSARGISPLAAPGCQTYWPAPFEVCGAIRDKYNSLGGPGGFLSWPKSAELTNPDGVGKRTEFLNGPIYWHPAAGAHPVVNHFMMKWGTVSWEGGVLGYPTSDEVVLQSSTDNIGRRQEFQGGHIYWHPTRTNLNIVMGAILGKYLETGAQNGPLGYPKSDEVVLPDTIGRMNTFEFGNIYFSPSTGAHPVYGTSDRLTGRILGKWAATGYEGGPFGYPTGDEQPQPGTPNGLQQEFQGGRIGWPTQLTDISDNTNTDWDEYVYDETSCDSCGNDDRITVTGPAWLDVPQPAATHDDPDYPYGRSSPPTDSTAPPSPNQMPSCDTMLADTSNWPSDVIFCTPSTALLAQELAANPPQEGQTEGTPTPFGAGDWDSATQPFCRTLPERQWAGNRSYQCMWREDWTFIYNRSTSTPVPGAKPVGRLHYVQEHELRTAWKESNAKWTGKSAIHFFQGGVNGMATTAELGLNQPCYSATSCAATGPGIGGAPVATQRDHEATFTVGQGSELVSGAQVTNRLENVFYFTHLQTNPNKWEVPKAIFPNVRCDNNGKDQGCVVPESEPILDMTTRPNAGAHADHIGDAQRSGLPGEPNGSPLTRANQAVAQQNRNKTCNLYKTKRPAGQDCDEYPFAATTQGGAVQNRRTWEGSVVNLPPITILDPDDPEVLPNPGMSLSLISSRANRSGGGVLTWFFRKNRVLDGENFYVKGS